MTQGRALLVAEVAACVPAALGEDCVRVAVDGVHGSGKSFFADELAGALRVGGREVVHVSADDWHQVRQLRYARGRHSPEGFWLDSYDYPRLRSEVLEPLGPGGCRWFRRRGHDLGSDAVLTGPMESAVAGAVVVVDGLFLQRVELEGCFEFTLWLDVPFEETARRMALRDGTSPDPAAPSMRGMSRHSAPTSASAHRGRADLVVDNTELSAPWLVESPLG